MVWMGYGGSADTFPTNVVFVSCADLPSIMNFIREKSTTTDKRDLMAAIIFHGRTRGAPDVKPGVRGTLSTLYRAAAVLQVHDSKCKIGKRD